MRMPWVAKSEKVPKSRAAGSARDRELAGGGPTNARTTVFQKPNQASVRCIHPDSRAACHRPDHMIMRATGPII